MPNLPRKQQTLYALAILVVLSLLLAGCTAPAAEQQDKDWSSANDLVVTSDRIIRAKFVESVVVSIEETDSKTGLLSTRRVLFRQFEVLETLKGTIDPEETLWIAFEPGQVGELVNESGALLQDWTGQEFVLFLKGRLRPLNYPTDYGPVLWTGNGRPYLALVLSGSLVFYTSRQHLNSLVNSDAGLPDTGSAAPFTLTLSELAALIN